jgi:hypothetical protein
MPDALAVAVKGAGGGRIRRATYIVALVLGGARLAVL